MPTWTQSPPDGLARSGLRLLRTPAARPLYATSLSSKLIGCPTHFYQHRTLPCERPNCPACDEGYAWRWHAYLACLLQENHETIIFECTAQAADAFQQYQDHHRTLRGCHFKAWRLGQKTNGRVIIQAQPADLATLTLPPEPDLPKILCHIWNVPAIDADVVPGREGRPRIVTGTQPNGNSQDSIPRDLRSPRVSDTG